MQCLYVWVLDVLDIDATMAKKRNKEKGIRGRGAMGESGIEKTNYEPPFVDIETFEIKRYSFEGGRSFVCITKQLDDALPLGRANGSRFMGRFLGLSKNWDRKKYRTDLKCQFGRSPRLTPPTPLPTVDEADDMISQDTIQVSLAEQKSREEQEARENVQLVKEHLAAEEIEKMVEEPINVIDDSSIPKNDEQDIPDTRFEPKSDKESPEVEITDNAEEEITNVVIPVNVNEEEEEITDEVYELKRREKGNIVEESRSTPFPSPIRSPRIHDTLVSSDTEKLQELTAISTPSSSSPSTKLFLSRKSFNTLADHLQEVMVESLPIMEGLDLERQQDKEEMAKMIAKAIRQERGNLQAEI
ncbi:hypothetical protein Tco_0066880 [Tanacetum coccineum]